MYKIISDSSCDLTIEAAKAYDVEVVPFYIRIGEKEDKENVNLSVKEFYQFMVDHKDEFPKTSTPSIEDYTTVFKKYLDQEIDIICICITSKFSGSYNSARLAKESLEDDYPDRKITVIDCTFNTVLQGTYVREAAKLSKEVDYDECVERIMKVRDTGRIFFTVGSFDYLIHGGRIGKVAGVAAKTLGIKPLIVLKEGEIFADGVARGRKRSIKKVIENAIKHMENNQIDPSDYVFSVGYGYDEEEGKQVLNLVKETLSSHYPQSSIDISLLPIGATIGVHTGPYPIGMTLIKKP